MKAPHVRQTHQPVEPVEVWNPETFEGLQDIYCYFKFVNEDGFSFLNLGDKYVTLSYTHNDDTLYAVTLLVGSNQPPVRYDIVREGSIISFEMKDGRQYQRHMEPYWSETAGKFEWCETFNDSPRNLHHISKTHVPAFVVRVTTELSAIVNVNVQQYSNDHRLRALRSALFMWRAREGVMTNDLRQKFLNAYPAIEQLLNGGEAFDNPTIMTLSMDALDSLTSEGSDPLSELLQQQLQHSQP